MNKKLVPRYIYQLNTAGGILVLFLSWSKIIKVSFSPKHQSFISRLVQKGVALEMIKELLGYEDLSTSQIYTHLQNQNMREVIEMF